MGRIKIKKRLTTKDYAAAPVDPTDVLAAWKLEKSWGKDQMIALFAKIWKHSFLEEARVLARATTGGYIVLAAFLDAAARDRAVENIRRTGTNAMDTECPPPATRGGGFLPPAHAIPHDIIDPAMVIACDEDMVEAYEESIATRMKDNPGSDFIFPDLSPEAYQKVLERLRRKPQ
jgi:hypothetical protein